MMSRNKATEEVQRLFGGKARTVRGKRGGYLVGMMEPAGPDDCDLRSEYFKVYGSDGDSWENAIAQMVKEMSKP